MKRAVLILGAFLLLSGCALIDAVVQPPTYRPDGTFTISVQATNVNDSQEWGCDLIPGIHIEMPEGWQLLGCTGSGLEELAPASAPIDIRNNPNAIAAVQEADGEEGYEWQDFTFEPVPMTTGQAFSIECEILPTTCGDYQLTYQVSTWPECALPPAQPVEEGPVAEDLPAFLEDIFATRAISCVEAVPTVSEWGMLVMALLLVGSAIWFIRVRKRRA